MTGIEGGSPKFKRTVRWQVLIHFDDLNSAYYVPLATFLLLFSFQTRVTDGEGIQSSVHPVGNL